MRIGYLMQTGVPDMRHQPLSGPANHVKQVIRALWELGHEVSLLAIMDDKIWKSEDLHGFTPITPALVGRGPIRLFERAARRLQYTLQLPYAGLFESVRFAAACRQELADCDLFFERMGWMGYGGGLASRWLNIPLVLEVNGDHLSELAMLGLEPQGIQRRLSMAVTGWAARQAAATVATGAGWRERHINRWQVDSETVFVVENGSEVVELLKREELRAFHEINFAGDCLPPVQVIYVGAFEPWHGVSVLLKAAALAVKGGADLHLLLVGSGSETESLAGQVSALNLEKRVNFLGQLPPEVFAHLMAQADIAVSPYCGRVEFSGLKLLDYKAAGLPTVASGADGQPAVINHGRTGLIVPPCSEQALAQTLLFLARRPEIRQRLGQAARLEAEQLHSWRHTALQLLKIFARLL
ncbi:MAG: glycosyltransferase family 4 protein [Ardenticatenaceae bacterium]|nr:glycosyltransferase family 4 protein [Ardenticatenaceae bacterium]